MMRITEMVLDNGSGEIGRYEVTADDMGDINLRAQNDDVLLALEMLSVGDTIRIVERWAERD